MFDNMVLCQSPAYYKDLQVGEGAKKKPTVKPIQKETSTAGN